MDPALFALMLLGQTTPSVTATKPPAEKAKLICRESGLETGSHIRVGTRCKTAAEWEREEYMAQNRRAVSAQITQGQGDALTKGAHKPSN